MRKWIFPLIAIAVLFLNNLLSHYPNLVERIYSEGMFLGIRCLYDYSIGLLPFPFIYIVFVFLVLYWTKAIINLYYLPANRLKKLYVLFRGSLKFISIIIILFYILWGFNYSRPTIKERLKLEIKPLDLDQIKKESRRVSHILIEARKYFESDSIPLDATYLPAGYESLLRSEVEDVLKSIGYNIKGRVRGRIINPKGVLMRFGTAGIYIPHAFEGHVDGGMHPIQQAAALAHEMTHAYGFTDEGECNFIAYLATIQSEDRFIRYSGLMLYWRYLISSLRRADKKSFSEMYINIPFSIKTDLRDIRKYQDRYPDLIPIIRNAIYNRYLKSHGVREGLLSYSQIVLLVDAWNRKNQKNEGAPE